MARKKVEVVNDISESPKLIASALLELSESAHKLLHGPLTKRAVCILIQASLPRGASLSLQAIESVLTTASQLGDNYVITKPDNPLLVAKQGICR